MIEMLKSMGCIQISNIIMLFLLTLSGGMIALLNAVYSRYSPPAGAALVFVYHVYRGVCLQRFSACPR
ncbi:MAG: hypothetical protein KHY01_06750 [Firmicutes bacterium]|nr:hypothetical protein [Bacillota bacterium]